MERTAGLVSMGWAQVGFQAHASRASRNSEHIHQAHSCSKAKTPCKLNKGVSLKPQVGARLCLPGDQDRRTVRRQRCRRKAWGRSAAEGACWRAACAERKSHAVCHLGQKWSAGVRALTQTICCSHKHRRDSVGIIELDL